MDVAPGAWRLALLPLVVAAATVLVALPLAAVFVAIAGAILLFYRDPDRSPPASGIVAPADGRVTVRRVEDGRVRLGIFMNVWHVHVNRSPVTGRVTALEHSPGANRPAFTKESDRNEQLSITLECDEGPPLEVILIAGAFARRIRPYVEVGTALERGERLGHIAFGSRVDVRFPPSVELADLTVEDGERVRAGETVLVPSGE